MRYAASEKLEIIRLVEQSHLPMRRTLDQIGLPRATFYRWYDLYATGGPEALADRLSRPGRTWNRIPDAVRSRIVELALEEPELSPREIAVRFTDRESYFVSEASVYRLYDEQNPGRRRYAGRPRQRMRSARGGTAGWLAIPKRLPR
jgi:putative transposase